MGTGLLESIPCSEEQWIKAVSSPYSECYFCDAKRDMYYILKRTYVQYLKPSGIYSEAIRDVADKRVGKESYDMVRRKLSLPYIRGHISEKVPSYTFEYKANDLETPYWCRVRVVFIDADENGELWHFGVNFANGSSDQMMREILYRLCTKVLLVNLTDDLAEYVKDEDADVFGLKYQDPVASKSWECFLETGRIYEEDVESFRNFLNVEYLKREMEAGKEYLQFNYRRNDDGETNWKTMEVWKSEGYTKKAQKVVITVRSASEEFTRLLNRATGKIRKNEIFKSDYLKHVSRDLRSPVNVIAGMDERLRSAIENGDKEKIEGCLTQLKRIGSYINNQLNNIESIGKMQRVASDIRFERESFPISLFFEDCKTYMSDQLNGKNISFSILCGIDVKRRYYADLNSFEEIVYALLSNAVKFNKDGGRVQLIFRKLEENVEGWDIEKYRRLECSDTYSDEEWEDKKVKGDIIELQVRDTGIGIEPEFMDKIYEPFQKGEELESQDMEGFGIGLAIVKAVITAVGGGVRAESEKGKGSCFYLTFFFAYDPRDRNNIMDA